jgi:hypothetical protein
VRTIRPFYHALLQGFDYMDELQQLGMSENRNAALSCGLGRMPNQV